MRPSEHLYKVGFFNMSSQVKKICRIFLYFGKMRANTALVWEEKAGYTKAVDLWQTKTEGFGWKKIYNQSITSIPELREAIKKLWVEKIGESVLEVAGQEHAQEDSRRHWKIFSLSYQILADI